MMTRTGETLILGSEEESLRIDSTKVAKFKLVSGGGVEIGVGAREDMIEQYQRRNAPKVFPPLKYPPLEQCIMPPHKCDG
jgi:hypothetical protein